MDAGKYKLLFRTAATAFFALMFRFCYSQTEQKPLILQTVDKGDYFYIPKYLMSDSVVGILYQDKRYQKTSPNKRAIEVYWISKCDECYYNIIMTPEQIFFSSSTETPNPTHLFWVIEIDSVIYKEVIYKMKQKFKGKFDDTSKNGQQLEYEFFDSNHKEKVHVSNKYELTQKYCEQQIKLEISKYFSVINSCINDKNNKIFWPSKEILKAAKPKYFSSYEEELEDWVEITK